MQAEPIRKRQKTGSARVPISEDSANDEENNEEDAAEAVVPVKVRKASARSKAPVKKAAKKKAPDKPKAQPKQRDRSNSEGEVEGGVENETGRRSKRRNAMGSREPPENLNQEIGEQPVEEQAGAPRRSSRGQQTKTALKPVQANYRLVLCTYTVP